MMMHMNMHATHNTPNDRHNRNEHAKRDQIRRPVTQMKLDPYHCRRTPTSEPSTCNRYRFRAKLHERHNTRKLDGSKPRDISTDNGTLWSACKYWSDPHASHLESAPISAARNRL